MNRYETMLILDTALDQEKINSVISRYEEMIKENGEIIEIELWGKKRLAYQINKKPTGYYVLYKYKAASEIPSKMVYDFNINSSVLRYMTIVVDKKMIRQEEIDKKGSAAESPIEDKPAAGSTEEKTEKKTGESENA